MERRKKTKIPNNLQCADSNSVVSDLASSAHSVNSIPSLPATERVHIDAFSPFDWEPDTQTFEPAPSSDNLSISLELVFKDMGYPKDEIVSVEEEDESDPQNSGCLPRQGRSPKLPNLRKIVRRLPSHSRMEMWNHQLRKPLRAISSGLPLLPKRNLTPCSGSKVVDTILYTMPTIDESDSGCDRDVRSIDPVGIHASGFQNQSFEDSTVPLNEDLSFQSRGSDHRWTSSRAGWPLDNVVASDHHLEFRPEHPVEQKMPRRFSASTRETDPPGVHIVQIVSETNMENGFESIEVPF